MKKAELKAALQIAEDTISLLGQELRTSYMVNDDNKVQYNKLDSEFEAFEVKFEEVQEESNIFRTQNITLHKRLECLLTEIDRLEEQRDGLIAEGSTPKNAYLHEIHTIFVDSGELHLINEDLSLVINCSNFVQDLATINDLCIKEAKRDLADSIHQIKQLNNDI